MGISGQRMSWLLIGVGQNKAKRALRRGGSAALAHGDSGFRVDALLGRN